MSAHNNQKQPSRGQRHRLRPFVAILVLMTVLMAACSSGDFSSTDSASQAESAGSQGYAAADNADFDEIAGDFEQAESPLSEADGSDRGVTTTAAAGGDPVAQLPDLGRDIIYTATIELASTDVSQATRNAIQAIEARGGFLFSQDTRGGAGGTSVLTFKIFPDQFQAALNDLGNVGDVRSQSISADDVSAIVVDLESRINTAEASVVRLRNLLDDASELETIATLENELLQRETTLEQLRGQLRSVRGQVDLATITVSVVELTTRPGLSVNATSYRGHDGGFQCFDGPTSRTGQVGDALTVCYRVTNTGDTPLIDLQIDDPAFAATIGSLFAVDGEIGQLAPGETMVLAHEIELTEPVRLRTSFTAQALDADGNELEDELKATVAAIRFDVTDFDDGFPSFGEVLRNSWDTLKTLAIVIALVAVAVAPFAAVALIVGIPAVRMWRRRQAMKPQVAPRATAPQPPPPAPPAPPAPDAAMSPEDQADAPRDEKATTTA